MFDCFMRRNNTNMQTHICMLYFHFLTVVLSNSQIRKRIEYKLESRQNIKKLTEKSEKLSVKNKFIATLTHEIRNFVTK